MLAYSSFSPTQAGPRRLYRPTGSAFAVMRRVWLGAQRINVSQREMVPCEALQSPRGELAVPSHDCTTAEPADYIHSSSEVLGGAAAGAGPSRRRERKCSRGLS
jgi:hypothetical protein